MDQLLSKTGHKLVSFHPGKRIDAVVSEIAGNAVYFTIGGKAKGLLTGKHLEEVRAFVKTLSVGDKVWGVVMEPETKDGYVHLSMRHAASESVWNRLTEAKKNGTEIRVTGRNASNKGITVELDSLIAFIPSSQIGKVVLSDIDDIVGKSIRVKVLDVDKARKRVIFSERAVSEAGAIKQLGKALTKVKEGKKYQGVVTQTTGFGAFVEIKIKMDGEEIPVEGLVHISELSWDKVGESTSVVTEGDEVEVLALGIKGDKLALSIKQAQGDPWEGVEKKYKVDTKASGKIMRVSNFGVFVELEPGIEGLIHVTKIPPGTDLKKGDKVNVYVEEVNRKDKKIGLGIVLTTKPVGYK